jgi:dTDP-glucose 4,6-dehydratase
MRHVLVTGSAGFIGSTFTHRLLAAHPSVKVVSLDALTYAGRRENLAGAPPERHTFIHGDVRDEQLVQHLMASHDIDTIVHFAAESHVDRSISGSGAFIGTNIDGTHVLLEAARKRWLDQLARPIEDVRFHLVSTDEVYGDLSPEAPASREGDPYAPSSPYAASKAAADHLVRAWGRTYGLPVTISHGSNTYGPRQFPEKLIPVVVHRASRLQKIPIYGDGQQRRDWLHVDDHADAVLAIVTRGQPGRSYNVGGNNPRVNLELVRHICRVLDELRPDNAPHDRLMAFVSDRPGHDRRYELNITRIEAELGWRPTVPWSLGLRQTIEGLLASASTPKSCHPLP